MPISIIIAAAAVALSIPILWYSVAGDRRSGNSLIARDVREQVTDARALVLEEGAGTRVAIPLLQWFASTVRRITPLGWVDALRRNQMLGGQTGEFALERVLALKFALGATGFLVALLVLGSFGGLVRLLLTGAITAILFFAPDAFVAGRARTRQDAILKELPDTLDQVTMSVDAGLGFEAALTRAATSGDGPFAEELLRTLREMQLGISREQALRNLGDRTDVADLDSFILAIVQSERYGIPVAQVLRVQAAEVRDKRKQRAEEAALKLPVKLIFPLGFCIFPAMFIVLLGPAVIRMVRDLGPALGG
jgi:tight adherence protein C